MPNGTDPRWAPPPPSVPDQPGAARPGAAPQQSTAWSSGSPPADVAALIAAHRGPVQGPPPLGFWSTTGRWWLAVGAVVLVGAGVIAAIAFGPNLLRHVENRASEPQQPTGSPVQTSSSASAAPPTSSGAPPGAETLHPHTNGIVYVETQSGKTQCEVSEESVMCQADFANAPVVNGQPANEVKVPTGGGLQWMSGNASSQTENFRMEYKAYQAQGWTISATVDGTNFVCDKTGHGMFVSISSVQAF
jgi:hypothetical protein